MNRNQKIKKLNYFLDVDLAFVAQPCFSLQLKVSSIASPSEILSPYRSLLVVKAGDVISIDGIVVEGRSKVDEQSLTENRFLFLNRLTHRFGLGCLL